MVATDPTSLINERVNRQSQCKIGAKFVRKGAGLKKDINLLDY